MAERRWYPRWCWESKVLQGNCCDFCLAKISFLLHLLVASQCSWWNPLLRWAEVIFRFQQWQCRMADIGIQCPADFWPRMGHGLCWQCWVSPRSFWNCWGKKKCLFLFVCFLGGWGQHQRHMEVPKLEVELDRIRVIAAGLCHSSRNAGSVTH